MRLWRHARLGWPIKRSPLQDLFLKTGEYMRDNILKAFPAEFQGATRQSNVSESYDMMTRPDLDKHIFMRVLEDRGAVELDAEGCVSLFWIGYHLCFMLQSQCNDWRMQVSTDAPTASELRKCVVDPSVPTRKFLSWRRGAGC